MALRRATIGDEETVRALRLRAMVDSPQEFSSTYEREAKRSTREWRTWFSPGVTFIFDDPQAGPVGMVAGLGDGDDPAVVHLMALWVDPAARGTGAGDALVAAVISWGGRRDARAVRLRVVDGNAPARRLYERHGFRPTGRLSRGVGPDVVEVEMERPCGDDGSDRR